MNYWHDEVIAEQRREEIKEEMERIRLEEEALAARPHQPGWYDRRMFNLGNWMIARGKQLRRRYDSQSADSGQTFHGSLVR